MYTRQRNEQAATAMSSRYNSDRRKRGIAVEVRGDEGFGRALRTWSKKVDESGLLKELKERMSYEKPAVERQRMKKQARKRWERSVEGMIESGHWLKDRKY